MIDKAWGLLYKFGFKKLFWCFFVVAIILVTIICIFPNNDAVLINSENVESYNNNWMLEQSGEKITLPFVVKTKANETVTISKVLPDKFSQSNPTLSFHTSLQTVTVRVEDQVIYTYCTESDAYFDVYPPPAWHVIRLSPDMVGKTIYFSYSSPFSGYAGVLNGIMLGTKYANVSIFVGSRLLSIILCFIIFAFGLFAIIISMFAHNKVADLNSLLYLGIASILISMWSACETKAMQVFFGNVQAIMFVTFLSVMLLPIAVLLFFREKFTGNIRKLYNVFIGIFSLYFAVIVLLQMLSVITFNNYFAYLLMLIGVMLVFILFSQVFAYKNNKTAQNKMHVIAVALLLVFSAIDMYRYFFKDFALTSYFDTTVFARIGIMAMLFILGYSSIRQILVYYSENTKAEVYKALSQTDSMSGLKNRAYLLEVCTLDFQRALIGQKPFSVIMVDVDNFKNYNDHYGHSAGDKVIQIVAQVLQEESLSLGGIAIRYGGEEFLLVLPRGETYEATMLAERIKKGIEHKKIIHEYNNAAPIVTVSQGICSGIPTKDDTLEHFIDCSDKAMYEVKRMNKNGYRVYGEN